MKRFLYCVLFVIPLFALGVAASPVVQSQDWYRGYSEHVSSAIRQAAKEIRLALGKEDTGQVKPSVVGVTPVSNGEAELNKQREELSRRMIAATRERRGIEVEQHKRFDELQSLMSQLGQNAGRESGRTAELAGEVVRQNEKLAEVDHEIDSASHQLDVVGMAGNEDEASLSPGPFDGIRIEQVMDAALAANTIQVLSRIVEELKGDLEETHGKANAALSDAERVKHEAEMQKAADIALLNAAKKDQIATEDREKAVSQRLAVSEETLQTVRKALDEANRRLVEQNAELADARKRIQTQSGDHKWEADRLKEANESLASRLAKLGAEKKSAEETLTTSILQAEAATKMAEQSEADLRRQYEALQRQVKEDAEKRRQQEAASQRRLPLGKGTTYANAQHTQPVLFQKPSESQITESTSRITLRDKRHLDKAHWLGWCFDVDDVSNPDGADIRISRGSKRGTKYCDLKLGDSITIDNGLRVRIVSLNYHEDEVVLDVCLIANRVSTGR